MAVDNHAPVIGEKHLGKMDVDMAAKSTRSSHVTDTPRLDKVLETSSRSTVDDNDALYVSQEEVDSEVVQQPSATDSNSICNRNLAEPFYRFSNHRRRGSFLRLPRDTWYSDPREESHLSFTVLIYHENENH